MLPHTLRMLPHTLRMLRVPQVGEPHTIRMLPHTLRMLRVPQAGEALRKPLGERAEAVPVQRQPLHTAVDTFKAPLRYMFKGPLRLLYMCLRAPSDLLYILYMFKAHSDICVMC